jgi:hypothetical protein
LILVDLSREQVPSQYRSEFEKFETRLRALNSSKFSAAKYAVSEIAANKWPTDIYCVGAHKMGPVPALKLQGHPVEAQQLPGQQLHVVVYPRAPDTGYRDGSTNSALFECLQVIGLAPVAKVYFEDVFEHLKDISDNLGLVQSIERIKAIRETLGQSVRSKLQVMTPSPEAWDHYQKRGIDQSNSSEGRVCSWFSTNASTVAEALYLTCLADWCASKFFDILGLRLPDRTIDVRNVGYDLNSCRQRFCAVYKLDDSIFDNSGDIFAVDEVFNSRNELNALLSLSPQGKLAEHLRDFLAFLLLVAKERRRLYADQRFVTRDALVFVSRRFASPYGTSAMRAIEETASKVSGGTSKVTTFFGDGGEPLRPSVKAQLWLADAVWSLIPEHDTDVGSNLDWIYLEAEQGVVCSKPSLCVCRDAQDLNHALSAMTGISAPMLADNVIAPREDVRRDTLRGFEKNVALIEADEIALKSRLSAPLQQIRTEAGRNRRQSLLTGILRLFEKDDILVLKAAFDHFFAYSFTKRELGNKIGAPRFRSARNFDNAFDNAHDRAKRFPVEVDGKTFQVLQKLEGTHKYNVGLINLARALSDAGSTPEEMIIEDVRSAFLSTLR